MDLSQHVKQARDLARSKTACGELKDETLAKNLSEHTDKARSLVAELEALGVARVGEYYIFYEQQPQSLAVKVLVKGDYLLVGIYEADAGKLPAMARALGPMTRGDL